MEKTRTVEKTKYPIHSGASNDNCRQALSFGRSIFPEDAVAHIYKPGRSVMTSGKARTKGWRLVFERHTAPFIEPLMGRTSGDDTLTQVELNFPTLDAAVRYAERQRLNYVVQEGAADRDGLRMREDSARRRDFPGAVLDRSGLFQESYGCAMATKAGNEDDAPDGGRGRAHTIPTEVGSRIKRWASKRSARS